VHWALEGCASVLKLLQLYEDENNVYMVLEYQPKGTLMTILESSSKNTFTESQARMIVEQILLALDYF
jgi:serine/threonine protein kinase